MATGTGSILETFALKPGEIRRLSINRFVELKYEVSEYGVSLNEYSIAGFGYMHSTNDRIYAVMMESTLLGARPECCSAIFQYSIGREMR